MILIDMQMPTNCSNCWIRQNMGCRIFDAGKGLNNRQDNNCPLIIHEPSIKDPVEPVLNSTHMEFSYEEIRWFACGSCDEYIEKGDNFCRHCGRAVKWE